MWGVTSLSGVSGAVRPVHSRAVSGDSVHSEQAGNAKAPRRVLQRGWSWVADDGWVATGGHSSIEPKPMDPKHRDPGLRSRDPWVIAAVVFLFGGAILLVIAWYDISGTANVYEQLPYLVSAGFSGMALIIVGSGLLAAGRADRIERRLAQLVEALTEAAAATANGSPSAEPERLINPVNPVNPPETLLALEGGETYHRPGCLLLRDKAAAPVTAADIATKGLTPCPVCAPEPPAAT
jgi:hypothetical protein